MTLYELLEKEHKNLLRLLRALQFIKDAKARKRSFRIIEQTIERHERFEEHFFYPILRDAAGANDTALRHASADHAEFRKLLNNLSTADPKTTEWLNLATTLETAVDRHIRHEESKVFPLARDVVDDQTARVLGREYDEIRDLSSFLEPLLTKIIKGLSRQLARDIEITIENLSLMPGSIGAVDLFMTLRNSLLRYDLHLLSSIFRSILRPIAAHGFAASIVLCIGGTAAGAFTSTPDLDYILVQQDDFDPAKPTSTQSLRGAKATRVEKLPQVLYEIGKNSHDADGGNPLAGEAAEKSRIVKRDVSTAVIEAKTRGYVGVNEAHGLDGVPDVVVQSRDIVLNSREIDVHNSDPEAERVIALEADAIAFGVLYVTPAACTLGWGGKVDFARLDREILAELPPHIAGQQPDRIESATTVSFITSSHEVVEYRLGRPDEYSQYKKMLRSPSDISFVRYDVRHPGFPSYSFTADNRKVANSTSGELTVQLPREQRWSEELFAWIVRHHSGSPELKKKIDIASAVSAIAKAKNRESHG